MQNNWRPEISDPVIVADLVARNAPYFKIIEYCRHIGLQITPDKTSFWIARVRKTDGGYKQKRIGMAYRGGNPVLPYEKALRLAMEWFNQREVSQISAEPYPVGSKRHLNICPIGEVYTVGHALKDYLDWKLLAATKSHFETLVSMCNHHLVPQVSHIPLQSFCATDFNQLLKSVLETSPKKGRISPTFRQEITELSQEQLRKRKKTCNSLTSILRGAFDIAWEHGHIDNDRPVRCLRRLPNVDRPKVIFLSRKECSILIDICHPDLKPLVLAALYTGCRANELISMQVSDFNKHTKSVYVSNPKGRRPRHILLPIEAVSFFSQIVRNRARTDPMFLKRNGRTWGNEYRTYFKDVQQNPQLPDTLTFHGLRHTYASQLIQNGASLMFISAQLGHANTQTVSSTYGHLCRESSKDEIERCFSPLVELSVQANSRQLSTQTNTPSSQFLNRYHQATSWPKSNFSKYSGPLLDKIYRQV